MGHLSRSISTEIDCTGICLHYHSVKNVSCDLETGTNLVAIVTVFIVVHLSCLKEIATYMCPTRTVLLIKKEAWLKIMVMSFILFIAY